ncbi:hypothetical protein [Deinococcus aluminii]|uniref:Uncharacterized protein n=1 Tax=Deinococcus aluminii TaxID=1656885 RepID=A0ABP9XEQ5_9DEIO
MNTVLLRTNGDPHAALLAHFTAVKRPASILHALELGPNEAYLAVTTGGFTQAFVVPLAPVAVPGAPHDLLLLPPIREQDNPGPCQVSETFLRQLSPAPLFLAGEAGRWRERAQAFAARSRRSEAGEVLLGTYLDARGSISYHEAAKKLFEKDARRYLKRVEKHLGRPARAGRKAVSYNPGGIAGSGEAALHLSMDEDVALFVEVDADGLGGPFQRASPSGVTIMWRFEGQGEDLRHERRFFYPNQWSRWDLPARDLAALIEDAYGLLKPMQAGAAAAVHTPLPARKEALHA